MTSLLSALGRRASAAAASPALPRRTCCPTAALSTTASSACGAAPGISAEPLPQLASCPSRISSSRSGGRRSRVLLAAPPRSTGNGQAPFMDAVVKDGVAVVGYPIGGDTISVTADLVRRVYAAIGEEAQAHNAAQVSAGRPPSALNCFTPNINLLRDPRWGRAVKTLPTLSHATPPIYKVGRVCGTANGTDGLLDRVNGVPACAHPHLLRATLNDSWGFGSDPANFVVPVLFPFGFGLSYTHFHTTDMRASPWDCRTRGDTGADPVVTPLAALREALGPAAEELVRAVARSGVPVVVVAVAGGPLDLSPLLGLQGVAAVLAAPYGGQQGQQRPQAQQGQQGRGARGGSGARGSASAAGAGSHSDGGGGDELDGQVDGVDDDPPPVRELVAFGRLEDVSPGEVRTLVLQGTPPLRRTLAGRRVNACGLHVASGGRRALLPAAASGRVTALRGVELSRTSPHWKAAEPHGWARVGA
eukprot:XP_001699379.1 predicted protein [Chlamydomonas reinhardtii]